MLAQLAGRDAVDIVAVVCRWFGGTKLGVGGLVRAYGGSLRDALDAAPLQPWEQTIDVIISHRHGSSNAIEQVLARFGAKSTSSSFGSGVERHVVVARDRLAALRLAVADASSGTARISLADDQSSRDQSSRTDW